MTKLNNKWTWDKEHEIYHIPKDKEPWTFERVLNTVGLLFGILLLAFVVFAASSSHF